MKKWYRVNQVCSCRGVSNEAQQRAIAVSRSRSGRAFYRFIQIFLRTIVFRYFRLRHRGSEHLETPGPLILAPVHRSNLDAPFIGGLSDRSVTALSKRSLFSSKPFAWVISALGAFPVERGSADRDALRAAQELLEGGASMIVFPEGTRQSGQEVAQMFDGPAFLAARTGAKVVPIGIAGTEDAMPSGTKFPRRTRVAMIIGEPLEPPTSETGRVPLSKRKAFTAEIEERLQAVFDEAQAEAEQV